MFYRRLPVLAVRLDPTLEDRLNRLAQETGRSKSHYVKQALQGFLEEREDYLLALAVLEKNNIQKPGSAVSSFRGAPS